MPQYQSFLLINLLIFDNLINQFFKTIESAVYALELFIYFIKTLGHVFKQFRKLIFAHSRLIIYGKIVQIKLGKLALLVGHIPKGTLQAYHWHILGVRGGKEV